MRRVPPSAWFAVELGFLAFGAVIGAKPAWHWLEGTYARLSAARRWQAWCRSERTELKPGCPAFWLRIPECQIDTLVLYGATEQNLKRAPAFVPLRRAGVVAAHRDKHFRPLSAIRVGSRVELVEATGRKRLYLVDEICVLDKSTAPAYLDEKAGEEGLIFLTCYPFHYVGPAPKRFIVRARKLEQHALATGRRDSYSHSHGSGSEAVAVR